MDTVSDPAQAAPRYAIETTGLTRRFGDLVAVDAVDLCVLAGIVFGLLGPNGAGKSTIIKMLTTLLPPSAGCASVAGFAVATQARQVRARIGYVPQLLSADGALTGRENLMLSAALYGVSRSDAAARIGEAFDFMGLNGFEGRLVRTYSGGMIRRLELAQAMLHRPAVLFLDEPTIGLDPTARHSVWERLRGMRDRLGMTILLTTHDMEEADALCDSLALLHRGRVVVQGEPAALKNALAEGATLDTVFQHYTGGEVEQGGDYRQVRQARATARRLG